MNKEGDILVIYDNPAKCEGSQGCARLIQKIADRGELEEWQVEFVNSPEHFYNVLIKKN